MKRKPLTPGSVMRIIAMTMAVYLFGFHHGQTGDGLTFVKEATAVEDKYSASLNQWEFKAVLIDTDEREATRKLNALASEGWQYVNSLGNGLVVFRRHYTKDQIIIEIMGRQPKTPDPGEKVAIVVTVRDGDRSLLPGAKVTVAAGGGDFLTETGKPIDPKDRGDHSNSVQGTTNSKGKFTTYWMNARTEGGRYVLGITATKKGYINGRADLSIHIQRR